MYKPLAALAFAVSFTLLAPALGAAAQQSKAQEPKETPQQSPAAKTDSATGAAPADALAPLAAQAQNALDRKDYAAAVPLLQQILAVRPDDALPHFELGYALSELKRYDEAAAEYRRAIELNPALAPAHLNLGLVLLESDPAAALASFRRAADLLPDQAQPRYLAGRALERAGKLPEAIEEYQAAVSLAPKDESMRFVLARALLTAGRAADAESQFRAALAAQPDATPAMLAPAKLGLAEALLRENKLAESADAFAAYLAVAPDDRAARFERAAALHDLSRLDDALAELDRADRGGSPTAESLKLRGSIYVEQKKWAQAAATIEQAVAVSPNDPELHAWLGRAKMELRDFAAAQTELLRSLMLDSASLDPMRDLVTVYYLSGQYPATLAEIDLLAKREVLTESSWFFRALACDKLNRIAEAAAAYQEFLDLDRGQHADQDWQAQQRLKVLQRETKK